jgi:hypothetical protein
MKFILKKIFVPVIILMFLVSPVFLLAQQSGDLSGGQQTGDLSSSGSGFSATVKNPISVNNINDFIRVILVGVVKIGIPIVALAIIYSGFLFVTARGNPESLKTAKRAFMYSVIGAAILLGSWAIAQLISDTVLEIGKSV